MALDADACYRALESRDRRFEGRFFVGVATTGIYCRPGCPARIPLRKNTRFFPTAAAAELAGLRPCRRCRPDAAPGSPARLGTPATVSRALRLIEDGALDLGGVDELASRLGVGARHLRRLLVEHLGAAPLAIARAHKVHFARRLLAETRMPISDVALASGFRSLRRFNGAMREVYRASPTELRRRGERAAHGREAQGGTVLELPFRPPLAFEAMLEFLHARAIPGVEAVEGGAYARTVREGGEDVAIVVRRAKKDALSLSIAPLGVRALSREELVEGARSPRARPLGSLWRAVLRARRLFDLGADPAAVASALGKDPLLAPSIAARPGLRVLGAWDPFELAVRAIVGQQITVRGATAIAGRIALAFGRPVCDAPFGLTRIFPDASALAEADLAKTGLTRARADAVRALARAVAGGSLALDSAPSLDDALARLTAIRGIGPWTAHMIAMRALGEPDAFPVVGEALARRAEKWRPWRAYAAMHLLTRSPG
jgi:AraC family transcriptional regulator of adaptative response / DNA-3-methyladenine glycosylase II